METVARLIAAALICSILCLLLQKQMPELTLALCILGCALCLLSVLPLLSPVLELLQRLQELTGLSGAVFSPLLKTAAISILAQLASSLCRDSGQAALAKAVETCAGLVCIYLALPLLEMVVSLLQRLIGG